LQLREMDQSVERVIQALLQQNIPPRLMSMDPSAPLSLISNTPSSLTLSHKSVSSLAMRGDWGVEEEDGGAQDGSGSGERGSASGGGNRSASPRLLGFPDEPVQVL